MLNIQNYLHKDLVTFFHAPDCQTAITKLVDVAVSAGFVPETEPLLTKVKEREKIVSTGIGLSVALPHAKLPDFDNFFIVIGVLSHGVDWKSIDDNPVRLVFMIAGPDNRQNEYLDILSTLTSFIKNEDFRKKLLTSNSPEAMIDFFKEVEHGSKNQ